jgi:hypothetical protein
MRSVRSENGLFMVDGKRSGWEQGDQIGRIFAHLFALFLFSLASVSANYRNSPNLTLFFNCKSYKLF